MSTLQTRLTSLAQAIGADIKQLNGQVLASGPTPLDTWHILGAAGEPAFATNVIAADLGDITFDVNDPQASPAFRKFPDGTVYLRGAVSVTVTTGSTGARAFTLPAGYRPPNMVVVDGTKISGATLTPVRLKIRSSGVVSLPASVAGDAYVLDGVSFDTETVTSMLTGPKGDPGAAGPAGPAGATGGNATVPMDPWHIVGTAGEPAFLDARYSSLNATNGVYHTVGFRKDPLGRVHLHGAVYNNGAAGGGNLFKLPAGYWPPKALLFDATMQAVSQGRVDVGADGYVGSTTIPTAGWITLDGVSFDTESVTQMPTGPAGPAGPAGAAGPAGGNATIPIDPWHSVGAASEPAFYAPGGWTNGGGAEPLRFRKDPLGRVWVRGNVSGGLSNSGVFTLPSGYRPVRQMLFDNLQTGATAGTYIIVNTDGSVIPTTAASVAIWIDISFDTESVTQMPTGPTGPSGGAPAGFAICSATTTAPGDGSYVSVTGLSYTVPSTSTYQIRAVLDLDALAGQLPLGWLAINGVRQTARSAIVFLPATSKVRAPLTQQWQVALNAGDVVSVQFGNATVANAVNVYQDHSTLSVFTAGQGPVGPTGPTGGNATIPLDTWHTLGAAGEPIFGTGWQHYAGGFQSVGFRKFPDGRVKLRGLAFLASGTGNLIFTLPSGYWPPGYVMSTGDSSFESAAATLDIRITPSNGQVTVTVPTGHWVSLDNVEFDTGTVTAMPTGPTGPQGPTGLQGPAGGPILQDEGIVLPSRAALNFTGLRVAASDDSANNRTNVNVAPLPLLNAFPASPVDGQEAYIDVLGPGGPTWHLRYRANHPGAYKWDVISSSNWLRSTPLGGDFTNSVIGTWQAQDAVAMTIYWPGIWEIAFGCAFWRRSTAAVDGYMGALFGSSIVGEGGLPQIRNYIATAGGEEVAHAEGNCEATLSTTAALRPAYFTSSALNSISFRQGWLRCRPVRLLG